MGDMKRCVDANVHRASFKQPCRNDDTHFDDRARQLNSNERARAGVVKRHERRERDSARRSPRRPAVCPERPHQKITAVAMGGSAWKSGGASSARPPPSPDGGPPTCEEPKELKRTPPRLLHRQFIAGRVYENRDATSVSKRWAHPRLVTRHLQKGKLKRRD